MSDAESPFWAVARGDVPPPPAAKLLGWKVVEARRGSGRIRVPFEATHEFTNPMGNVQGGLLAAMLDETLGSGLAMIGGGTAVPCRQILQRPHHLVEVLGPLLEEEGLALHRELDWWATER
jgi:hypothetical protein